MDQKAEAVDKATSDTLTSMLGHLLMLKKKRLIQEPQSSFIVGTGVHKNLTVYVCGCNAHALCVMHTPHALFVIV